MAREKPGEGAGELKPSDFRQISGGCWEAGKEKKRSTGRGRFRIRRGEVGDGISGEETGSGREVYRRTERGSWSDLEDGEREIGATVRMRRGNGRWSDGEW